MTISELRIIQWTFIGLEWGFLFSQYLSLGHFDLVWKMLVCLLLCGGVAIYMGYKIRKYCPKCGEKFWTFTYGKPPKCGC